ncbi:MAG: M949_RS01915 family surface polysaccharide biosynthesis protein [Janthinobacterium lividum]
MLCSLTFSLLLLAPAAHAQLQVSSLTAVAVPARLPHTGSVVQALRYTDRTGTYTVLATQVAPRIPPGKTADDGPSADLYAYQYPAASTAPSWQLHDYVAGCPLDLQARFCAKGLSVTDLNQDGTAEVWLVYRTVCRGDVSPSTQKIIMYEGSRKYAVRGTSRLATGPGQYSGGTYTLDAIWQAAPAAFRQHAAQIWQQHLIENSAENYETDVLRK